ncbi:MAG: response regulator transcription factor [Candidatus Obscuribacterales bacterium]|nr:response regulator transcription factor [Cyanobacteria bacterium SZAS LIN-5]RTL45441.1 MAG: response regulator transcription factor [Candidatus Melainabacteria bacterium]
MAKLLLVDDDENLVSVIEKVLTDEKHVVDKVHTGSEAKAYLQGIPYDVIVLDWSLPDTTGVEICLEYRASGGKTPIIFLTGHDQIADKMTGLDAGADDYLTKPFAVGELVARIRALLRRPVQVRNKTLSARDLELDPITHAVKRGNIDIKLYPKEFSLLEHFLLHPNQVFSVDDLLDRVWKTDADASTETVRMTIMRLRQKIETDEKNPLIQTLRGVGYRLQP